MSDSTETEQQKRQHSIKWTVIISCLIILAIVGTVLGLSIVNDFKSTLKAKEGEKIFSVLQTVTVNIDGDRYENLVNSLNDRDPYYEELRQYLLKVKNETGLRFLFTESYLSDGKTTAYIVDGNEPEKEDFSPIGTPVNTETEIIDTEETIKALTEGIGGYTDFYETDEWGTLFSAFAPIYNSQGKVVGVVGADADANDVSKMISNTTYKVAAIIFFGFAIIIILIAVLISRLLQPVNEIKNYALEISKGNLALDLPDTKKSNNEIGEIYNAFSLMRTNMAEVINSIKESVYKLIEFNNQLVENAKMSSSSAEDISSNIVEAANSANEQEKILSKSVEDMEEIKRKLDKAIERLQAVFEDMKTEEETSLAKRIEVDKFGENISLLSEVVQTTQENLNELFGEIKNIYVFTETMNDIAAQTNLLSLNAGIEAAKAGDAGCGFAVVAHEIQTLSQGAKESASNIEGIADKINSKATETIKNMDLTVTTVKEGVDIAKSMKDYIQYIMQGIENNVDNVNKVSEEYVLIQEEVEKALQRFNEINKLIKEFSERMGNIAAASQEQTAMNEELGRSTEVIKEVTQVLEEKINTFTT